jgi:hypothetical protein
MMLTVRAEDVMTPRRLLKFADQDRAAQLIAEKGDFDAVPILRPAGLVVEFWSRPQGQRARITARHRVRHDKPVEHLLRPLGEHLIQFVYYRSELVGLIDASDLNKPIARLAWLYPMLELERAILEAVRLAGVDQAHQADALGFDAATARRRQAKAERCDLGLPLLEFAQFSSLLRAAGRLGIVHFDEDRIRELNDFRNRAAHGARERVIEDRKDCERLLRAMQIAREGVRCAGRTSRAS